MYLNKRYSLLLIFFILIIVFAVYFTGNLSSDNSDVGSEAFTETDMKLIEQVYCSVENNNLRINDAIVYWGDNSTDTFRLSECIVSDCLIYRYSGDACQICVKYTDNALLNIWPDYQSSNRILIVTSDINDRLKKTSQWDHILSLYKNNDLGLPYEESCIPFLFVSDTGMVSSFFFIPDIAYDQLTTFYLHNMELRYDLK